ncbi:MAG: hypothetical protein Q7T72_07635 [Bacteroidales bacterium]|nr:hypothetical protein [Bacteroidales bacterium]
MKKHNGMRPQDIVVLLKIIALKHDNWKNSDLAYSLQISPSEISEVLNRCKIAGLIDSKKRKVHINSFKEFLIYGLKYVFPAEPGSVLRGIPTAHSAFPISEYISSGSDIYVWPYAKGNQRGQAIEPLYKTLPATVQEDKLFYELLVIIDTIRVGRAREIQIAIEELEKRLQYAK